MRHITRSQQFNTELIKRLFDQADIFETKTQPNLTNKLMASLFYEPSTRTRFSFEAAMLRLGGQVITTENAKEFSSTIKGETLEDSIAVISRYADVIVLRHFEPGASEKASKISRVPVINAGDGAGQHPTQALLDLYTIHKELKNIDGIKIAIVGDLKNGRTVRSLAYLLGKYRDIEISLVSPTELKIGQDIKTYLKKHKVSYQETEDLNQVIDQVDVLYQTRIQQERFSDPEEYLKLKGCYIIDKETAEKMKKGAIIMHPLPRVDEIKTEVDDLPQAAYFKQAGYGLWIRMALLDFVLNQK